MRRVITSLVLILLCLNGFGQQSEKRLDFNYEGIKLSGVLNLPTDSQPKGIILIVHGDGPTDAVAGQWWGDVRQAILQAGYATYMWDKMGCGESDGQYEPGRPVHDEAREVMAAIRQLKTTQVKGSQTIGLWGISRAGWINPLVIDSLKTIDFWISVSGVDDDETFEYLLKENLRLAGYEKDTIRLLLNEWQQGLSLSRNGAGYEEYLAKTVNLQSNPFWQKITNGGIQEESYYAYQNTLQNAIFDPETGLPLYVKDFDSLLADIHIPVLALFGENDRHVDWQTTRTFYQKAMKDNSALTIKTFKNCNHNMWRAQTGSVYEFEDEDWQYTRCEGFLSTMTTWLTSLN